MRRIGVVLGTLVAALLLVVAGVLVFLRTTGLSARAVPGPLEARLARAARSFAIPADARNRPNPVPSSPEAIADGLEHFADHCAVCHANDGSGNTEMGRGMYPPAPDMRLPATQSLTDGELFYIIENGIRFTGMPAWGTGDEDGERASWHLVHFIRQLPRLTPEQLERMKEFNPRSPAEIRQEIAEEEFLRGGP